MKLRYFRKFISFVTTFAVLINSIGAPLTVLAQTVEPTSTPEATETSQETASPDPTITPTEEPTSTPESTPTEIASPTPEVTPSATDEATPVPGNSQPETQSTTNENAQTLAPPAESPTTTPTAAPELPKEEGTIATTVVENIDLSTINLLNSNVDTATVTTDKPDYSPTGMVLITGTGFTAEKTYTIEISSEDEPPVVHSDSVTADSQGLFTYSYQLDGNYRPNYKIDVKSGEMIVASTTFTDSDSGFFAPNQTISNNSVVNPDNGWVSDNARATFNSQSDYVNYGFPSFSIPSGSIIDGIVVTVEGRRNPDRDLSVALWNSSNSAPDAYTNAQTATFTSSETTITLGGVTNKWGKTWTVADFDDATFSIQVHAISSGPGDIVELDQVQVKVYYSKSAATSLTSSKNPSNVDESVTFTATVTGSGVVPTGTVTFKEGGTNLSSPVTLNGSGAATYVTSSLTAGSHPITAVYNGGNYDSSTSSILTQVVNTDITPPTGGGLEYFDGYRTHVPSRGAGEVEWIYTTPFSDPSGIASQSLKLYKAPLINGVCGSFILSPDATQNVAAGTISVGFDDYPGMLEDNYCHKFELTATDGAGNTATFTSPNVLKYDTTAPSNITISNYPYRHSPTGDYDMNFSANWSSSSDSTSGIDHYTYSLSHNLAWDSPCSGSPFLTGTTTNQNLSLNYTATDNGESITVKAVNGAGLESSLACMGVGTDNVAPTTTISATSNGSPYTFGNITDHPVNVSISCTDTGVGVCSNGYSLDGGSTQIPYTTPFTISDAGITTIQYISSDSVGNVGTLGAVNVNIVYDTTPPLITKVITGTLGSNGWYTSDTTVTWTVSDPESAFVISSGCGTQNYTSETTGVLSTCSAESAGGSSSDSTNIKIDKTGPETAYLLVTAGTLGSNGWYTSDVTVATICNDSVSPLMQYSSDENLTIDTAGHIFNGYCTNWAGLTTDTAPLTVKLDKTLPFGILNTPANSAQVRGTAELNAGIYDMGSGLQKIEYWFASAITKIGEIVFPSSETLNWNTALVTDGLHDVWAVIFDNAGNFYTTASNTVLVDNTAPTVGPISITPSYMVDGHLVITALSTISADVSDSGSGIDPTSCRYSLNNGSGGFTEDPAAYDAVNQRCVFTNVDTSGATGIAIAVDDNAGNWFDTTSSWFTDFTVDTTPPTVVSVDSDGQTYNQMSSNPTIKITFSEDISNIPVVGINPPPPEPQTINDCSDGDSKTFCFVYSIQTNEEHQHRIHISDAQDISGNVMEYNMDHTFVVDTVAPTATVSYDITVLTNSDVVASLNPVGHVTITNNGGSGAYTFTDNGSFTFEFTDGAGNQGTAAATVTNIDKSLPLVSFIDPTPANGLLTNNNSQVFRVSVNEPVLACTLNFNGNYSERQIVNGLSDGSGFGYVVSGDDSAATYVLPFLFTFYGNAYSQLSISTNALMDFGSTYNASYPGSVGQLRNTIGIATLWNDLVTTVSARSETDAVRFRWTGTGWSTGGYLTNEAVLRSNGDVELHYGDVYLPSRAVTAGLSAGNNVDFVLSGVNGQSTISPVSYAYSSGATATYPMAMAENGEYYVQVPGIQDGHVNFSVTCQDLATNEGDSAARSIIIDTQAPVLSSKTEFGDTWYGSAQTSTFTYSDANGFSTGSTPACTIDNEGMAQTCSIPVNVCDNAGNCNTETVTSNPANIDSSDPVGNWVNPVAESNVADIVPLEVNANDGAGVSSVRFFYRLANSEDEFTDISTDTEAPFSAEWDTSTFPLDYYTLRAVITDQIGNILILDENVWVGTLISGEDSNTFSTSGVTITWTTNRPTTSRVVYDTVQHPEIDEGLPNYGYAYSTATYNTDPKVLSHSITIDGLASGTLYYYRVISVGSPAAIGNERGFKTYGSTGAPASDGGSGVLGISTVSGSWPKLAYAGTNGSVENVLGTETEVLATPSATATEVGQTEKVSLITWVLTHKKISLGVVIILIALGYYVSKRKK